MNNPFMNTSYMMEREMRERPERARRLADAANLPDPLFDVLLAAFCSFWQRLRVRAPQHPQARETDG